MASTDIIQIDQIAPVAFEETPVHVLLQILQLIIIIHDFPIILVNIDFPALYFTVYDLGERDYLAGNSFLNYEIFCCPLCQSPDCPVHSPIKMDAVQGFEKIVECFHFEGIIDIFFQNRHKNQQTVILLLP